MADCVFRRKIYDKLLDWKHESKGESALLIEGARRIGKSTIVEQFARNEYKSYIMIDFSSPNPDLFDLFKNMSNLDDFFMRLKLITHKPLYERNSLIIFDEVQLQPLARQAIKHLVADGRYDYIETGSLISIQQNVKNIVIPSEEESMEMFPMDYEEFCWAIGDEVSFDLFRSAFSSHRGFDDATNRQLMRSFRLYMLVGGMPQAVSKYIETKDFGKVDAVKRKILELYFKDLHRLDPSDRAVNILKSVPSELHKNQSRFKMSSLFRGIRTEAASALVNFLSESKIVNVAYHADDPNVGMNLSTDRTTYKIYLNDTGLFVTLAFWDKGFTENVIYTKLLSDKLEANLGYVYENVVAQMVASAGNKLFYYTFPTENRHLYEIDFLLSRGNKLYPVEVKSSGYGTHASLDAFAEKYSARIAGRYLVCTKDLHSEGQTTIVPMYLVPLL
ncbi:MAG: ATP-binding protein [bacterium]|nr:ATP-binding protein [Candidatus Colousia faecequi]